MEKPGELVELEQLKKFRIAAEDTDPRGWSVISCDADKVGVVRTMLIDTKLLKARYLVCDLHPDLRPVILPLSYARLDPDHKHVIFDLAHTAAFGQLPRYGHTPPTEDLEDQIHQIIAGTTPPHAVEGESVDRRKADRRD